MDYSLPGSSVHKIFQARVLEWVAISFSRGSSWLRDWTQVSCIGGRRFIVWATREVSLKIAKFLTIIRDMHEWKNDIPTLFTYLLMKLQPREWFGKICGWRRLFWAWLWGWRGEGRQKVKMTGRPCRGQEVQALGLQIHYHIDYFRIYKEWMFSNSFKI